MKTKIFPALIFLIAVTGCSKMTKPDYLYLNADQLKPLGIELNDNGIFYKNENPNYKQDHQRYECLAFYCTAGNYVTSSVFNSTDTLTAKNTADSTIISMEITKNDFYPLLIGDTKGNQSMDNTNLAAGMKLLPVAIPMIDAKLSNRTDTIIVWIKPTEALKKALPKDINIDNYLVNKPVK
jgi:hypothetical protein